MARIQSPPKVAAYVRATSLCRRADTLLMEFGVPDHMKHMEDRDRVWSFEFRYELATRAKAEDMRDRMVNIMGAQWLTASRDWDGVKSFVIGFGDGLMATLLFPERTNNKTEGTMTCWAA